MAKLHICIAESGRGIMLLIAGLFLLGITADATAQGRRGPQLSPEKQAAAQELEATYVAKNLKLSDEATGKIVAAYQKARKNLQEGIQALSEGSGFEAYRELSEKEREKFKTELKGFLDDKQVKKALVSLGTFSWSWDRMVDNLAGYKLDEKKLYEALGKVNDYIIETDKAFREARESSDWQSMRPKFQELKEKLDSALESLLSKEQLEQWKEATTRRRRN